MNILRFLVSITAVTILSSAQAGVMGMVTASTKNVSMTVLLNSESQLMINLEIDGKIENCPVSLSNADMGYSTPQNMTYEEMENVQFFAFWHGRDCWERAESENDYLQGQTAELDFFQGASVPADKGVEMLKSSGIKLSFCFQTSDPYECSKPVGYDDLKNNPVQVYPFKTND